MSEVRTEAQAVEERLLEALTTIRDEAPMMLPDGPGAVTYGVGRAALITLDDDDERDGDIDGLTRRADAMVGVTATINAWSRLVVEDAHVTETIPDGRNLTAMCEFLIRWARWMSGHAAAWDMVDELDACVGTIRRFVPQAMSQDDYLASRPPMRYRIGRCPVEREVEVDGHLVQRACGGKVYAHPDDCEDDDRDLELRRVDPWATCMACEYRAVVSHWQRLMFPEVEVEMRRADRALTVEEVITLAHKQYGIRVSKQAVWQWVRRRQIQPIDSTTKPYTFRLCDVIDTLTAKGAG